MTRSVVTALGIALALAAPGLGSEGDGQPLEIVVPAVGQRATGTVSVFIESPIGFQFVIDEADCPAFHFTPGSGCTTEMERRDGGTTTTILVEYRPQDDSTLKGRMRVTFDDGREEIITLIGRVGDGKSGRVSIRR